MSDKNIDKDIEIVKDTRKFLAKIGLIKERTAIENVLSELETYKKIVEKINNLEELEQYAIDRNLFVKIFSPIYEFIWDEHDYESDDFKFWSYADEWYILHKPSGTLVNWYKHLGRTNTCNKILSEEEYKTFVEMFTADWQEKR